MSVSGARDDRFRRSRLPSLNRLFERWKHSLSDEFEARHFVPGKIENKTSHAEPDEGVDFLNALIGRAGNPRREIERAGSRKLRHGFRKRRLILGDDRARP